MTIIGNKRPFGIRTNGEEVLGFNSDVVGGVFAVAGSTLLDDLVERCGLLFSTTPETDETDNGYNMVVTDIAGTPTGGNFESGAYIKMSAVYAEVVTADTQNILYTAGVANIIAFDDLANITGQQFFVSEDKQNLMFYNSILEEGSPCLFSAMNYLNMNEPFQVQTEEGSGLYENFVVEEGDFYVVKSWVSILD